MKTVIATSALFPLIFGAVAAAQEPAPAEYVVSAEPLTPEQERKTLHVPPGFEIQLVAAEPAIAKPVSMAFDAAGRLWVAETRTYPIETATDKTPRDAIKILSEFGEDGRARKIETFADGLNMPDAVAPYKDGAVVFTAPDILRLQDTDGDGRADRRTVLYGPFDTRDMHNMANNFRRGFDGWLYGGHGLANVSTVRGRDGHEVTMAGATFRFRDDGSRIEIFGRGQVNPFGICFDPLGNVYASDCHTAPIYELLRGAVYPSFGKPHDGLGFGPIMMRHTHGSTAIAGLCYYEDDQWPDEFRGNMFVGNVVTNRVNRDRLTETGSTRIAHEMPDLVISGDPWFRPVDVQLGLDGALYVADFYNPIVAHVEVPLDHPRRDRERGRIWRVVYRGKSGKLALRPPRNLTKAPVAELVNALGDRNFTVRLTALNRLADTGGPRVIRSVRAALRDGESGAETRSAALWILERLGVLEKNDLARALGDSDRLVRTHALRVLAERPALSPAEHASVIGALRDREALVRRVATDALARHPATENLRALLDLRHAVPAEDTHLLHVVRMALRDQLRTDAIWGHVVAADLREADRRAVADVALGVHTAQSARFLLDHIQSLDEPREMRTRCVHYIARYGEGGTAEELLAFAREAAGDDGISEASLLKAIHRGTGERGGAMSQAVRNRAVELAKSLIRSTKSEEVDAGIDLAESLKLGETREPLVELVASRAVAEERRAAAMSALAAVDATSAVAPLGNVLDSAAEPIHLRDRAAQLLARVNTPEARSRLLHALPLAPGRLQTVIALGLAGTREGAEGLLREIAAGKASARLLQEQPVQLRLRAADVPGIDERLRDLLANLPAEDERLRQLLEQRRAGLAVARPEAALGAAVFEKNCAICHQIGGKGVRIGPQLDGIGARGAERLMEDILDPNRNLDPIFRVTILALKDGRVISGTLLREEGQTLVLADAQGKEIPVEKATIKRQKTALISPMPDNFAEQISETDFYDLVEYLLSHRVPPSASTKAAAPQ